MRILSENLFPVVGVGASAGGLEAFKTLVKAIPVNSGLAYILIQHLSPKYESLLTEILQKNTTIPVVEITDNIKVQPDHIYVIPPNKTLTANDGVLNLDPRIEGEKTYTIDSFFISLAEVHQEHAIGVLLSGSGSDGTVGLKAIKDLGGLTIAQDMDSAAYHNMPKNAIDAEVVDFILPPQDIPKRLKEILTSFNIVPIELEGMDNLNEEQFFKQILFLIRTKFDVDFTYYKQTTIHRRILRRIALSKTEALKDYYAYLLQNKVEQNNLFKDLLIPVTAFFRDAKTFEFLSQSVFPDLFKTKSQHDPIRLWVAGCSTGEEAYSLAICLHEYIAQHAIPRKIQIYATDISEPAIAKARSGIYSKKDMAGVSDERIKMFFVKTDGRYHVHKMIREVCVFACQNFLKDPPFAKMDLVSCRNVLIYMEPYLQRKAFKTFHYALNNAGFLLLGKSESTGQSIEEFHTFNLQEKIFTKISDTSNTGRVSLPATGGSILQRRNQDSGKLKTDDFYKAADDTLLTKYAAVGVIVNEQLNILQFRGLTAPFLEAPPGKANHNLLKMAKVGLSFELRNALIKARVDNAPVKKTNIPLDGGKRLVDIEVFPLQNTIELYFLVLFQESPMPAATSRVENAEKNVTLTPEPRSVTTTQLELEITQMREDMRLISENQEVAFENLQSANEDLLSGSEELQTLNEELETTKEEIQSSNEELTILNQELIERNEQLIYTRKYAEAIVTTIHEPLIILTKNFEVKSANKAYYEKFATTPEKTENNFFFTLDNMKWNVFGLRDKLDRILPDQSYFENLEVTINAPDSPEMVLTLNARQLVNESSSEQLILLAMHDITESKMLEVSQKLFAQELEASVIERTKDLKEANINLLYYNENLQQFASIASHDLQEPLRKIKTFTTILNKKFSKDLNDQGREVVNKIEVSAHRMSQLIKEVLEYSKILHVNKNFSRIDLDLALKNVILDLDLLITERKAVIHYKNPLPKIDAISLQMNQLFYNLLTNALKFQKENISPVITISHSILHPDEVKKNKNLQENVSYLRIEFADNGIGFEQEFALQIFQIFERLHSPDEFEGTGIGLALCKKIVENHYGDIIAQSNAGEGATFYVTLPIIQ